MDKKVEETVTITKEEYELLKRARQIHFHTYPYRVLKLLSESPDHFVSYSDVCDAASKSSSM